MMTDDEIIAVVQAHKEGKKIERSAAKNSGCFGYTAMMGEPDWNFAVFDYRVSPEPRKPRERWIDPDGIESFISRPQSSRFMRFREVIE